MAENYLSNWLQSKLGLSYYSNDQIIVKLMLLAIGLNPKVIGLVLMFL